MDTIAELFARNILDKPHTDEELKEIIKHLREKRAQYGATPKKGPAKTFTLEDLGL